MPRKAMLAGVLFSGLLLAGCEWCGNCRGLCGGEGGSSYASGPNLTGPRYSNPVTSTQTPSSMAANPSASKTTGLAKTVSTPDQDVIRTGAESTKPFSARKAVESNVGPASTFGASRPSADEPPNPEPYETQTVPESTPTLQPPPRTPGGRPMP